MSVMQQVSQTLSLLLISDLHSDVQSLQKLKLKLGEKKFDFTFVSGDVTNLTYDEAENPIEQKKFEDDLKQIIGQLVQMQLQPQNKIFYIPGNHDHQVCFDKNFQIDGAVNIEKNFVEIFEGLFITGFGGSLPGYDKETGQQVFRGHPYNNEQEISKSFDQFIKNIDQQCQENQFILMTHCGPNFSKTTLKNDFENEEKKFDCILTGTNAYDEFINKYSHNIIFYQHGHTHNGKGQVQYKNTTIINPDSLSEKKSFVIVELNLKNQKWILKDVQFDNCN